VTDTWNPSQYERFRDERSRPFFDLLALVRSPAVGVGLRAVDLGCGTGELTRKLHERLGGTSTLGVDSSDAMLARCEAQKAPGLSFEKGDIAALAAQWAESPPRPGFDLVFSNAALHWVDGHDALLASLTRGLRPQGQLAVQIPANDDHPTHVIASEVAGESPFREALGSWRRREPVYTPERYAALLHGLGYAAQDVRLQVYGHVLASRDGVFEWVKGSLLTDYERRLGPLFPSFAERYRSRLLAALEDTRPYFYPFKRILLWALRP